MKNKKIKNIFIKNKTLIYLNFQNQITSLHIFTVTIVTTLFYNVGLKL